MRNDYQATFEGEVAKLRRMRGVAMLEQIQRIVELARTNGDADAQAEWQLILMDAASHLGRLDYEIAALTGLRMQYETDARFADLRPRILWYFKWIGERLAEHAELSAEMIDRLFVEMEAFYRAEKENLRPVYALRCVAEALMGHQEAADRYRLMWEKSQHGNSDDCPACETHARVQYFLLSGKPDEAIEAAAPVLAGEQFCEEVPATTFSRLLIPMLLRDELDAAEAMHQAVLRQVRSTPSLLSHLSNHLVYRTLTGRAKESRRLGAITLARGLESANSYNRFSAFRACALWLGILARSGVAHIKLPRSFDGQSGEIDVPQTTARCLEEARALAEQFDARNGNGNFKAAIDFVEQLLRAPEPEA